MKKISIILTATILFNVSVAFALPQISSEDDQYFLQDQDSTQLRIITITEDSTNPIIEAGLLKISIPDDISIIFDSTRTVGNMLIYGTAVDSGKVLSTPEISFENKDKTILIPILEDFSVDEYIVLKNVYVEGFNNAISMSKNIYMNINDMQDEYTDDKTIVIHLGTYIDDNSPDSPTNIIVQDDANGVKITWTDPTDLDLQTIHILKGVNQYPIDAGNPTSVGNGIQEYIDTNVTEGDTVKYILRGVDGSNVSDNSEEIQFVVGTGSTATDPPVEDPPIEDPPIEDPPAEDPPVTEPPVEDPPVTDPPATDTQYCSGYTDVPADDEHCAALTYVTEEGIFEGYPDGTFGPEQEINRAETVKIVIEGFNITLLEDDGTDLGFSDVTIGEWYMPYLNTAKQRGIVQGYPDGTFNPEQTVNYIEMLKIFFETAAVDLVEAEGDQWYQKYLDYAIANNLVPYEDIIAGMKRVDVAKLFYQWSLL